MPRLVPVSRLPLGNLSRRGHVCWASPIMRANSRCATSLTGGTLTRWCVPPLVRLVRQTILGTWVGWLRPSVVHSRLSGRSSAHQIAWPTEAYAGRRPLIRRWRHCPPIIRCFRKPAAPRGWVVFQQGSWLDHSRDHDRVAAFACRVSPVPSHAALTGSRGPEYARNSYISGRCRYYAMLVCT